MDYWEKRNVQDLLMQERKELKFERALLQEYELAKGYIKERIELFNLLYSDNGKLSYKDTLKKLNRSELKNFKDTLAQYKRSLSKYSTNMSEAIIKSLEKDLERVNITRLEALQKQIDYKIAELKTSQDAETAKLLGNSYEDSYYRTIFNLHQRVGYASSFVLLNTKAIARAVYSKYGNESFSSRIWQEKDKLVNNINTILAQNIVRGTGIKGIVNDILNATNSTYYNASRLARTELNRVCGLANKDGYDESNYVEEYRFVAVLDSRTSEVCADLDGQIFSKSEYTPGVNAPPMHPNCRSTTIGVVGNKIKERIAKDTEGKYIKISSDMTYYDWAKIYCPKKYAEYVKNHTEEYAKKDINTSISQIDKERQKSLRNLRKK